MSVNELRITIDVSCAFQKDYFTFYNRDWNSHSETNFGITCSKCSMKLLSDLVVKIGILEISNMDFRAILI